MANEQMKDWQNLRCECGSEQFLPVINLRYKEGAGTTNQPAGFECAQCRTKADTAYLLGRLTLKRKMIEMKALEEEIAAAGPPRKEPAPGAAAPH